MTLVRKSQLLYIKAWRLFCQEKKKKSVMNKSSEGEKKLRESEKVRESIMCVWGDRELRHAFIYVWKYTRKHDSSKKTPTVKYWTQRRHRQPTHCMHWMTQRIFHLMRSQNSDSIEAQSGVPVCVFEWQCLRMCCKAAEDMTSFCYTPKQQRGLELKLLVDCIVNTEF